MSGLEARRAAIRAQLDGLTERELRVFVAELARRDVDAVELPLAEFLAIRAQVRETSAGMLAPDAVETYAAMLEAATPGPAVRQQLHAELDELTAQRRAWDEAARACVCPAGLCSRREFADHTGEADPSGCMVCAELDPAAACYAAVARGKAVTEPEPEPFWDIAAANAAESVVIGARIDELAEVQRRAWRRIPAAKGRLTRAQRDGSAEAITAAAEHLRQVQDEADRLARAAIPEMQAALGRGLENTSRLFAAVDQVIPDREAGQ